MKSYLKPENPPFLELDSMLFQTFKTMFKFGHRMNFNLCQYELICPQEGYTSLLFEAIDRII